LPLRHDSLLYILIRGSIVVSIPVCHAGNPATPILPDFQHQS